MTDHDSNLCWCETCYYPQKTLFKAPYVLDDEDDYMELED